MINTRFPRDVALYLRKWRREAEADVMKTLSDEQLEARLRDQWAELSELEQRRLAKAAKKLQSRLERMAAELKRDAAFEEGRGHRIQLSTEAQVTELHTPPFRRIKVAGQDFDFAVAKERPREVVLIGQLPVGAVSLAVGSRRFKLTPTRQATVHRCRDLGRADLETMLVANPNIELIVA